MATTPRPTWPTREEYDLAMQAWTRTLNDPALRMGELSRSMGNPRRYGGAALYVSVYKISDWMVRCFTSNVKANTNPPKDIAERYQKIAQFTQANLANVSALIPIHYLPDEILVSAKRWPLVKMPFLSNAQQLGSYLQIYREDRARMHALGDAWRKIIHEMEAAHFAHGDLDLTNVLVQQPMGQLSLKLIDYDNVYIPELAGAAQTEYGHEAFQHPAFQPPNKRPYDERMDRFSALVIYLCIRALELQPSLYKDLGADESERLLMTRGDYDQPGLTTSNIQRLQKKCGGQVKPLVDELMACLNEKRMPRSLDEIPDRVVVPSGPAYVNTAPQGAGAASYPYMAAPTAGAPLPPPPMMAKPAGQRVYLSDNKTAAPMPGDRSGAQRAPVPSQALPNRPSGYQQGPSQTPNPWNQAQQPLPANTGGGGVSPGVMLIILFVLIVGAILIASAGH
ncbi:MAG TPA: lipopolysaccharide kinase InaA family protein [Ktedonobacterales bacterium]|nr:lipopolysaccharide kinase InaA family protein [Ktedonobacterales bacterium]